MKKKTLATLFLSLCLCAQLNFCSAEQTYDEEITLPIGTNFDLEMEEVTRYEYDGEYVKALTVNNKEQFILQKAGDTIITVIMDDKGVKTELKVLVHIVSEEQFNNPNAAKAPAKTTEPAKPGTADAKTDTAVTTAGSISVPATTATPGAKQPTVGNTPSKPSTTTPAKPAATPAKATAPATTAAATTTPAKTTEPAKATTPAAPAKATAATASPTKATEPAKSTTPAAPAKPVAIVTAQTITRPTAKPQNNVQAVKYKADQYAFDVLDLVNAEREKLNLRPLSMAKDLLSEANLRARELPSRFSHTRPDGSKYFTIMSNRGTINAENIAAGQTTPAAVVKAWLNSKIHREAILNPNYTELGVGYFETSTANYSCYWIQLLRG